jgi:hypothetical protein
MLIMGTRVSSQTPANSTSSDNIVPTGISGINAYLNTCKDGAEDIMIEVFTKDSFLQDLEDTSKGKDPITLAAIKIDRETQHTQIFKYYNQLRRLVDAFITELESQLILRNKTDLENTKHYHDLLVNIDKVFGSLQNEMQTYRSGYAAHVAHHFNNPNPEGDTGGAFSITSLIPNPLTLFEDIISWVQSKRDFRAQQIQSINTMLEANRLRSITDLQANTSTNPDSSSGAGDDSKNSSKGNKKKAGGKQQ